MSRIISACILLILISLPASAQKSPQAVFDEANTLFEAGDFSKAMEKYRTIDEMEQVSGALYLNMGITAVQLDSMGLAKYYFLKARHFKTTKAQAEDALEFVNSKFSRQSAKLPKLPWDRAVDWINDGISASGLFLTGFFVTLIGLVLLYLGWLKKLPLAKVSTYMLALIVCGSLLAASAFYADYVNQRYHEAVLIIQSQRVLQTPKADAPLESIAYEGYDLTVDTWKSEEQPGWLYVRLGNGQFGWLQKEGVKTL